MYAGCTWCDVHLSEHRGERTLSIVLHQGERQHVDHNIAELCSDEGVDNTQTQIHVKQLITIKKMGYNTLLHPEGGGGRLELQWNKFDSHSLGWDAASCWIRSDESLQYPALLWKQKTAYRIITQVTKDILGPDYAKDRFSQAYMRGTEGINATLTALRKLKVIPAKRLIMPDGYSRIVKCTWNEIDSYTAAVRHCKAGAA